ncbi:MAG: hypothetical protein KKF65_07145 [Nanoarchaeota archaeon]|nr:hypothetical protein [Nanoarchaeota archaeon]
MRRYSLSVVNKAIEENFFNISNTALITDVLETFIPLRAVRHRLAMELLPAWAIGVNNDSMLMLLGAGLMTSGDNKYFVFGSLNGKNSKMLYPPDTSGYIKSIIPGEKLLLETSDEYQGLGRIINFGMHFSPAIIGIGYNGVGGCQASLNNSFKYHVISQNQLKRAKNYLNELVSH